VANFTPRLQLIDPVRLGLRRIFDQAPKLSLLVLRHDVVANSSPGVDCDVIAVIRSTLVHKMIQNSSATIQNNDSEFIGKMKS
jgi:hypothetical protein